MYIGESSLVKPKGASISKAFKVLTLIKISLTCPGEDYIVGDGEVKMLATLI
jgi:hypothetical protein